MKAIHSDILQFRGSHYEFGFFQGEQLKESMTLHNRLKQWKTKRPRFESTPDETEQAYARFAPSIYEELMGLRDSLELSMEEILLNFGGYRINFQTSGCSVVTGQDFMVRNYDFHPQTYEGRYVLFQPEDTGYAVIGPTSRITGRTDGMNEKGLVMAHNFIHRKKPGDGFVCYMISRIVLETCATAQEAIAVLQSIPHRGSFSYTVLDAAGESFVVEASPRAVHVRQANSCTNHFETQQGENRHYLKDSYERLQVIGDAPHTDALKTFRLFNDTDKGVFSEQYKSWAGTIHTSGYFPKKQQAWFALGGNQEPVLFDFGSWLSGEELQIERMDGTVNTELQFANMK